VAPARARGHGRAPDSRRESGHRLRPVQVPQCVDGLIGQGLRILVLVTTNEPIKALHPAVARPGRCAANIEFERLSTQEADEWLEKHGAAETVGQPTLLADLYAAIEGREAGSTLSVNFAD
jgi:ATP-dependent 26S proteasome regulatory subunit